MTQDEIDDLVSFLQKRLISAGATLSNPPIWQATIVAAIDELHEELDVTSKTNQMAYIRTVIGA